MKKLTCALLGLLYIISGALTSAAWAQEDDFIKNTQNDIVLVGVAGAAGAVIGLSTLSFVDKPSQHISNVWTGAALGVIAGVVFVAYNSAQKGSEELQASADFNSSERLAWHHNSAPDFSIPEVQFGTQFLQLSF